MKTTLPKRSFVNKKVKDDTIPGTGGMFSKPKYKDVVGSRKGTTIVGGQGTPIKGTGGMFKKPKLKPYKVKKKVKVVE